MSVLILKNFRETYGISREEQAEILDIIYDDLKLFVDAKKGRLFDFKATSDIDKRNYITKRFRLFREKYNIDSDLKLYSFRHTFITRLYLELRKNLSKEETIKELSLIIGHTSKAIFAYIQTNDIELPEDYSKLLKNSKP